MRTRIWIAALALLQGVSVAAGNAEIIVLKVQGTVLHGGKAVKGGQALGKGKIEVQGTDAFVDLKYPGGHLVRMREGRAAIWPGNPEGKNDIPGIALNRGLLAAYVAPVLKKAKGKPGETRFRVRTRTAVMGVRGTKFFVQESPEDSYLCVCEGVVSVESNRKQFGSTNVSAGQDLHVKQDKAVGNPVRANDRMWVMSTELFKGMGVPVASDPR